MKQNLKIVALATLPLLLAYAIVKGYEYWNAQRVAKKAVAAAKTATAAAPSTDEDNG